MDEIMKKRIEQQVDDFFAEMGDSSKEVFKYYSECKGMTLAILKEKIKKAVELWEIEPYSLTVKSIEAPLAHTSPIGIAPGVVRMAVKKRGNIVEEYLFFEENQGKLSFHINMYGYTRHHI